MKKGVFCSYMRGLCLVGLVICLSAGWLFTAGLEPDAIVPLASSAPQGPSQAQPPVPAPSPAPANASVHTLTQAAVNFGVLSCLKRINQVATYLTANTSSGVFVLAPQTPPDQHVLSASFEMVRPDNSTFYATASFFPNSDAVYDTVEYVEMTVEKVEKTVFKDLKRVGIIKKNVILLDGGAVKVFLMPAGTGCIVIKKEVL